LPTALLLFTCVLTAVATAQPPEPCTPGRFFRPAVHLPLVPSDL